MDQSTISPAPNLPPQVPPTNRNGKSGYSGKRRQDQRNIFAKFPKFDRYDKQDNQQIQNAIYPPGFMTPLKDRYLVQLDFNGLRYIAKKCYNTIKARDPRVLNNHLEIQDFEYVCYFVLFTRLYKISQDMSTEIEADTFSYPGQEADIRACSSIVLPDIVVQYIESIGMVKKDYITYVPLVPTPQEFLEQVPFRTGLNGFHYANQPTVETIRTAFPIHRYITEISAARRLTTGWRPISFDKQGKDEMLVSYGSTRKPEDIKAYAFTSLSERTGMTGACFKFWNNDDLRDEGDYDQLASKFEGRDFDYASHLASMISFSLVEL